jgi:protoporphyrinogen oxidase
MTKQVLVIGAGFSGLSASIELINKGNSVHLVESSSRVGGLSETLLLRGVRFEIGPHIYFDKDQEVVDFWEKFSRSPLMSCKRKNRLFFNKKFIKSPLNILDATLKLGLFKVMYLLISFAKSKFQTREIKNAEDWVISNFGSGLYKYFFKTFNEKIWGIPCTSIPADWSGQRIKANLLSVVWKSFVRDHKFIVKTFLFPKGGSEDIYMGQLDHLKKNSGFRLFLDTTLKSIKKNDEVFEVNFSDGTTRIYTTIISTIPLGSLVEIISRKLMKENISELVSKLKYRSLIYVIMIFNKNDVKNFNEHWIDVHDSDVKCLRVTNFSNYSFNEANSELVGLGVEYNCFVNEEIWKLPDSEILKITLKDLMLMKITRKSPVDMKINRYEYAYPLYDLNYKFNRMLVHKSLANIKGLHLVGRNGLFTWNNMHHSVKTGILGAQNIQGESHDLFAVKGLVSIGKELDG